MYIQISDHAYQNLIQAAKARGTTPEELVELLAEQVPIGFAQNEDTFFHALGFDDTQIEQVKERAKLLPDNPNW